MPKARTKNNPPPDGWDIIESTLDDFDRRMRDAEMESDQGKRKVETVWPIFRIHHQRSRYIYEMYSQRKEISRELYEYCLREGYADGNLIAKWKKGGYERLCCLRCIQSKDTNYGTTCICRVPKENLEEGKIVQCLNCGCRGCSSGDTHTTIIEHSNASTELPIAVAHHTRNQSNVASTSSSSKPSIPTVIPPVPLPHSLPPYPYPLPPGYPPMYPPPPPYYYPPGIVPPVLPSSTVPTISSASTTNPPSQSSSSSSSSLPFPTVPGYPPPYPGYPPYGYPLPPGYPFLPPPTVPSSQSTSSSSSSSSSLSNAVPPPVGSETTTTTETIEKTNEHE